MTKKKKTAKVVDHQMYIGHHAPSVKVQKFAKCICGVTLEGQEQIDEHQLLFDPIGKVG